MGDTLQAMAPISFKTVHQTSLLDSISRTTSIDSDCCRLLPASVLSNKADESRSDQLFFVKKSKFLKATRDEEIRKIEIPTSTTVEALRW